jgi:hypothetical protein
MPGPGKIYPYPGAALLHAMLYNFETGKFDLKPEHESWLKTNAAPVLRHGGTLFLKGMASRLGSDDLNQWLSGQRIDAVLQCLQKQVGTFPYSPIAYGESRSVGGVEDDEWHRGVELNVVVRPPPPPPRKIVIPGDDPHEFEVKLRMLSANKVVPFHYSLFKAEFIVRDKTAKTEAVFLMEGKGTAIMAAPFAAVRGREWMPVGKLDASLADFVGEAEWKHQHLRPDMPILPGSEGAKMPLLRISSDHLPDTIEFTNIKVFELWQPGYWSVKNAFRPQFPIPRRPRRMFGKPFMK